MGTLCIPAARGGQLTGNLMQILRAGEHRIACDGPRPYYGGFLLEADVIHNISICIIANRFIAVRKTKSHGLDFRVAQPKIIVQELISCGSSGSCDAVFWRQPVKTGRSMTQSE